MHVLLSCPPNLSPSKIMQYVKGKSARKLLMEFKHLQKTFWGRHLWARGYFVASSGNVTDEVIQKYVRQQDGTEPDDGGHNFRITNSSSTYRLQPVVVQSDVQPLDASGPITQTSSLAGLESADPKSGCHFRQRQRDNMALTPSR
jgi:hypothetical protein